MILKRERELRRRERMREEENAQRVRGFDIYSAAPG